MDQNLPNTATQPINPVVQPQAPVQATPIPTQPAQAQNYSVSQSEHDGGKSALKVFLVLLLIIGATAGLVYVGVLFMGQNKTTPATRNANVYAQPTRTQITPTPTGYQSNPNDTTDNAINQDSQVGTQNLDNLNSSLNDVDQSLKDQQTNLQ
jgi:hypothetical protein